MVSSGGGGENGNGNTGGGGGDDDMRRHGGGGCSADSPPEDGGSAHGADGRRYKPVLDAIRGGDYDAFEAAADRCGGEALGCRDEWGYTPAHWAALYGDAEVLRYLVARGVAVDTSCYGIQGSKPVHWACRKGHTAAVQVLLQVSPPGEGAWGRVETHTTT